MVERATLESFLPEPKVWPNGEIFTYTIEDMPQFGTVLVLTVENSPIAKGPNKGKPLLLTTELNLLLERPLEFPQRTMEQLMAQLEQAYDSEVNGETYRKERQDRINKYRGRSKPPETGVDIDEQT